MRGRCIRSGGTRILPASGDIGIAARQQPDLELDPAYSLQDVRVQFQDISIKPQGWQKYLLDVNMCPVGVSVKILS